MPAEFIRALPKGKSVEDMVNDFWTFVETDGRDAQLSPTSNPHTSTMDLRSHFRSMAPPKLQMWFDDAVASVEALWRDAGVPPSVRKAYRACHCVGEPSVVKCCALVQYRHVLHLHELYCSRLTALLGVLRQLRQLLQIEARNFTQVLHLARHMEGGARERGVVPPGKRLVPVNKPQHRRVHALLRAIGYVVTTLLDGTALWWRSALRRPCHVTPSADASHGGRSDMHAAAGAGAGAGAGVGASASGGAGADVTMVAILFEAASVLLADDTTAMMRSLLMSEEEVHVIAACCDEEQARAAPPPTHAYTALQVRFPLPLRQRLQRAPRELLRQLAALKEVRATHGHDEVRLPALRWEVANSAVDHGAGTRFVGVCREAMSIANTCVERVTGELKRSRLLPEKFNVPPM